jgi:hypothetical protein
MVQRLGFDARQVERRAGALTELTGRRVDQNVKRSGQRRVAQRQLERLALTAKPTLALAHILGRSLMAGVRDERQVGGGWRRHLN